MICYVGGTEMPASQLAVRPMNFGQRRAGVEQREFCAKVSSQDVVAAAAGAYERFRCEMIADEPYDDGSFVTINALREQNWPRLDALVREDPVLFGKIIKEWLYLEVLERLFPASEPKYWIDGIEVVNVSTSDSTIEGVVILV